MSTPTFTTTLWSTADGARYFLISNESVLHPGSVELRCLDGRTKAVEVQGLVPLEVTEHQARRWAKDQLGQTLDELRHGIGERLADLRNEVKKERAAKRRGTDEPPAGKP